MIDRIRNRLSYANVVATVALFIALGGSSYAALTLPRNSVGDNQIRAGAVRSSEVRDRSLRLRDLSLDTRSSLRGQRGLAGPTGAQGVAGAAAVKYFAVVDASGGFVRGNATSGGRAGAIGSYTVSFGAPVSACAYSATLGTSTGATSPPGRVTVNESGGGVGVQTYDAAGSPADLGFHLSVAC